MNSLRRRFLSVLSLLTRLPLRQEFEPDYSRSDFWLPLIGPLASIAALLGLAGGFALFRDPLLGALSALALQYAAFNLFHLDGLLDTADAMMPFAKPERRLEILKDSRIGSYAFFAGFLVLAAKLGALARLAPSGIGSPEAVAALLAAPVAGRAAAAIVPLLTPPARPGGLGALMRGFKPLRVGLGSLLALLPLGLWAFLAGEPRLGLLAALSALFAVFLSGLPLAGLYRRRIGGFTGDALGAAVELGELFTILALAALSAAGFPG